MRKSLNVNFATRNLYIVELVSMLTLFDISMIRFAPWMKSNFFEQSEGYHVGFIEDLHGYQTAATILSVVSEIVHIQCEAEVHWHFQFLLEHSFWCFFGAGL